MATEPSIGELIVFAVLGVPAFVYGFRVGWRRFHRTLSRSDEFHLSADRRQGKQFQFALSFGATYAFLVFVVVVGGGRLAQSMFAGEIQHEARPAPETQPSKPPLTSSPNQPPTSSTSTAPVQDAPNPLPSPAAAEPVTVEQSNLAKSANVSVVASTENQWTREEVERLEKEKQYAGDDPLVRARLGLPPKPAASYSR